MLYKWKDLPKFMRNAEVWPYYNVLRKRYFSLIIKRIFDFVMSSLMLVILSPVFLFISILIKIDSHGSIFFKQQRVTQYGKLYCIYKFRTMIQNADKIGNQVTIKNDKRITRIGGFLRCYRLDELPQLINIWKGEMSFVGTRPEIPKYVKYYTKEMYATLLLPAGVTSEASIQYKDEAELLEGENDIEQIYTQIILPQKMMLNLNSIKNFSITNDLKTIINTIFIFQN